MCVCLFVCVFPCVYVCACLGCVDDFCVCHIPEGSAISIGIMKGEGNYSSCYFFFFYIVKGVKRSAYMWRVSSVLLSTNSSFVFLHPGVPLLVDPRSVCVLVTICRRS